MERLTKWLNDKKNLCIKKCEKECVEKYTECHKCEPFKDVMKRLAEYEDAEEHGLLLRLPFPLGTTVYYVDLDTMDYNYIVCEAKFSLSLLESKKKLYATFEEASLNKRRFGER